MPARVVFEYAVIRIVPRVERGECINAGVVLFCRARRFLDARIALMRARLSRLRPTARSGQRRRTARLYPADLRGRERRRADRRAAPARALSLAGGAPQHDRAALASACGPVR